MRGDIIKIPEMIYYILMTAASLSIVIFSGCEKSAVHDDESIIISNESYVQNTERDDSAVDNNILSDKVNISQLNVKPEMEGFKLSRTDIKLRAGKQAVIRAKLPDGVDRKQIVFISDNISTAEIVQSGETALIKAVGEGTAVITARLYNGAEQKCTVEVTDKPVIEIIDGVTYMDGVLIVNKTYPLPESFGKGLDKTAEKAFYEMAEDAEKENISLRIVSGFRSYKTQSELYKGYCNERGKETADTFSARPGHSEHQTGLAMDINSVYDSFADTKEAKWLAENCPRYGFIIRYPKGKESITGYKYESWHIRYVGKELAEELTAKNLTLEEYFGIDSKYSDQ